VRRRATIAQKKTGRPVQFEITEQSRSSVEAWLPMLRTTGSRYLFPSRLHASLPYPPANMPGWCIAGRLCLHRKRIDVSTALAGQKLGIKEVDAGIWLASFMHYDPGSFDPEQKTLQPLDNPFGTRLSLMS
jgi:hypothetical protein